MPKKTKAPSFQFYPKDWLGDEALRKASPATRGIWMDALCYMWQNDRSGKIVGTEPELCRMLSLTQSELKTFLGEIKRLKIGDVTFRPSHVTVINRRMSNEHKARESSRLRKQRQRSPTTCPKNVTPPSSSSSSSASAKKKKEGPDSPPPEPSKQMPPAARWQADALRGIWNALTGPESRIIADDDPKAIGALIGALSRKTSEDIERAMNNYDRIVNDKGVRYHKIKSRTLLDFITFKLDEFTDDADPFENFKGFGPQNTIEDLPKLRAQLKTARDTREFNQKKIAQHGSKPELEAVINAATNTIVQLQTEIKRLEAIR